MLSEHAAVDHFAFHILTVNRSDAEFNKTIGEECPCAGFNLLRQGLEASRDQVGSSQNVARSNGKL